MEQREFEQINTKRILELNGLVSPTRISENYILGMVNDGNFAMAGNTFAEAVKTTEGIAHRRNSVVLFPSRFEVSSRAFNRMSKSLEWFLKIDSQQVLREVSGASDVSRAMTREFLEHYKVRPEHLLKAAFSLSDAEHPGVGFYWVGWDRVPRTVMLEQSAASAEIILLDREKHFVAGKVKDKVPYGRSMRVEVSSRSAEGKSYEFSLFRMPIFSSSRDPRIYSYWVNMGHNSSDPFASYMSEHEQQALPQCFWSTSAITGAYLSMAHLTATNNPMRFKINPFPIPANAESAAFRNNLRSRSLIMSRDESGKFSFRPLNKSEMNRVLFARTAIEGYDNCWFNMGKRDMNYLYAH